MITKKIPYNEREWLGEKGGKSWRCCCTCRFIDSSWAKMFGRYSMFGRPSYPPRPSRSCIRDPASNRSRTLRRSSLQCCKTRHHGTQAQQLCEV